MKKVGFSLMVMTALLTASSSTFAFYASDDENDKNEIQAGPPCPCLVPLPLPKVLHEGLYVGLGVGYDAYRIRQSTEDTEFARLAVTSIDPALSAKGWLSNFFAGYGLYFKWFYMGTEIGYSNSDAHSKYSLVLSNANYTVKFNAKNTYSFAILPGFRLNNASLLYARLGFVRTYLETRENAVVSFPIFSNRTTKWGNTYNVGLGFETALYRNFSLRGDYNYSLYKAFSTVLRSNFKPSNNQFVLGLIYHFC